MKPPFPLSTFLLDKTDMMSLYHRWPALHGLGMYRNSLVFHNSMLLNSCVLHLYAAWLMCLSSHITILLTLNCIFNIFIKIFIMIVAFYLCLIAYCYSACLHESKNGYYQYCLAVFCCLLAQLLVSVCSGFKTSCQRTAFKNKATG